jgi:hypothetical protein
MRFTQMLLCASAFFAVLQATASPLPATADVEFLSTRGVNINGSNSSEIQEAQSALYKQLEGHLACPTCSIGEAPMSHDNAAIVAADLLNTAEEAGYISRVDGDPIINDTSANAELTREEILDFLRPLIIKAIGADATAPPGPDVHNTDAGVDTNNETATTPNINDSAPAAAAAIAIETALRDILTEAANNRISTSSPATPSPKIFERRIKEGSPGHWACCILTLGICPGGPSCIMRGRETGIRKPGQPNQVGEDAE